MKYLKLVFIIFWMIVLSSCSSTRNTNFNGKQIKNKNSKLIIGYNENLETLALIYNLSESGEYHYNKIPGPRATLSKELTSQFESFKNHEAVTKLNKLLNDGFVDMYDILLSLYNTNLPEYKQYAKYPSVYYENEGITAEETQARFDDFNKSVIKFYKDADLKNRFKKEYNNIYKKIEEELQTVIPKNNIITELEDYYGVKRNEYEIIISAFSFNGIGRAILIKNDKYSKAACLVTSNHLLESDSININKIEQYNLGYKDIKYFQEIGIHELIHTFLHEIFKENEKNTLLINELNYLFTDSLKNKMKKQGYTDWKTCFEEHLVRLGELKIAQQLGNHDFVTKYRKECIEERGFIYFELIENLLLEYENNRIKYKNFEDFIPKLVQNIKSKTQIKE